MKINSSQMNGTYFTIVVGEKNMNNLKSANKNWNIANHKTNFFNILCVHIAYIPDKYWATGL